MTKNYCRTSSIFAEVTVENDCKPTSHAVLIPQRLEYWGGAWELVWANYSAVGTLRSHVVWPAVFDGNCTVTIEHGKTAFCCSSLVSSF